MKFAKKSRFNDGGMIFWQTLLVLDQFECVLLISELQNTFQSILRRNFALKLKNGIFPPKNVILHLNDFFEKL